MRLANLTCRFAVVAAAAVLLATAPAGCGNDAKKSAPSSEEKPADKHAHSDDHDGHDRHGHDHPSEGPHHGHLIELGKGKYHGELLHDHKSHTVTIYILDGSAKKEVRVKPDAVALNIVLDNKPTQFSMKAVDSVDGMASQFALESAEVLEALEGDAETKGRLSVTIDGKPYVGSIEHHSHGEHEHGEHEHEEHEHAEDEHNNEGHDHE
jgi:hypothetical protein